MLGVAHPLPEASGDPYYDRPMSWQNGDDQYLEDSDDYDSEYDDDDYEVMTPIAFEFVADSVDDPKNCFVSNGCRSLGPVNLAFMTTYKLNEEQKRKDFNVLRLVLLSNSLRAVYQEIRPELEEEGEEAEAAGHEEAAGTDDGDDGDEDNIFRMYSNQPEAAADPDSAELASLIESRDGAPDSGSGEKPADAPAALGRAKSLNSLEVDTKATPDVYELEERGYSSDSDSDCDSMSTGKKASKKLVKIRNRTEVVLVDTQEQETKPNATETIDAPAVSTVSIPPPSGSALPPLRIPARTSSSVHAPSTLERSDSLTALQDSSLSAKPPAQLASPPQEPESMFGSVRRKLSSLIPSIRSVSAKKSVEPLNEQSPPSSPPSTPSMFSLPATSFSLPVNSFISRRSKVGPKDSISTTTTSDQSRITSPTSPTGGPSSPNRKNSVTELSITPVFDFDPSSVESEIPVINEMKRKSTETRKRKSSRLSTISASLVGEGITGGDGQQQQQQQKAETLRNRKSKLGLSRTRIDPSELVDDNEQQQQQQQQQQIQQQNDKDEPSLLPQKSPTSPEIPTRRTSRPDFQLKLTPDNLSLLETNSRPLSSNVSGSVTQPPPPPSRKPSDGTPPLVPPRRDSIIRSTKSPPPLQPHGSWKYAPIVSTIDIPKRSSSRFLRTEDGKFDYDDEDD
ncbi:hypothetical protein BDR26DRAFT_867162 [Obelidium mucronatum]|nr:hypothetical protein BDR26DRAFT_867162 [Obelidium mucronatum]